MGQEVPLRPEARSCHAVVVSELITPSILHYKHQEVFFIPGDVMSRSDALEF